MRSHEIVIVGGGNAGISVAAQLLRKRPALDIAILDPADRHYYQPAWTLVGGGVFDIAKTARPEASVIPPGATWYQARVESFSPETREVVTAGGRVGYRFLVVCPGIQLNWSAVKGLPEALGRDGVCSNYAFDQAPYTARCLETFQGGTAIFTSPATPVKCGGAPQKIMYLAADHFRRRGLGPDRARVEFYTGGSVIFGVKKYAAALDTVVAKYGIGLHFKHDLIEIRGASREAVFRVSGPEGGSHDVVVPYDMIHVTPPQSAPDFIRESPLVDENGWVDVDRTTLRHVRYPDIFALGDVTNTPNAKTGAAVRKQAPVVVANLLAALDGGEGRAAYNGYGSCPLVTGYGRLILAEFGYDNEPMETFPIDQSKPRWSMYQLKRYVLPWLYWNRILKGTA